MRIQKITKDRYTTYSRAKYSEGLLRKCANAPRLSLFILSLSYIIHRKFFFEKMKNEFFCANAQMRKASPSYPVRECVSSVSIYLNNQLRKQTSYPQGIRPPVSILEGKHPSPYPLLRAKTHPRRARENVYTSIYKYILRKGKWKSHEIEK